ncbi:hypothetical protein [Paenibacillus sp. MMS20-IR301]|nr:hypothetical protein [Paenibacillus sp. MMS20-IR301]WNS46606.1 hypothetical protein LOS79_15530 [Paenibacillus sp. MMS20-IR301]
MGFAKNPPVSDLFLRLADFYVPAEKNKNDAKLITGGIVCSKCG